MQELLTDETQISSKISDTQAWPTE